MPPDGLGRLPAAFRGTDLHEREPSHDRQAQLTRTTFSTSRLLDFASVKELIAQTGHEVGEWPLVILKELFDNALDAARRPASRPVISGQVDASGIAVSGQRPGHSGDDGQGHPRLLGPGPARVKPTSPRRAAPRATRSRRIVAMPFVLDGERGQVEIAAQGERHRIAFAVDRIRQVPVIAHEVRSRILVRREPTGSTGPIVLAQH